MKHNIALIQMVSSQAVEVNLKTVQRLVYEAADKYVEAIFLPENFAALGNSAPRDIAQHEASKAAPIQASISSLAKETGCWIFAGTLPLIERGDQSQVDPPRVRAASLVFDSEGIAVARYDKIHMFDVDVDDEQYRYRESEIFEPGEDIVCIDSIIGNVGLSVCYDIRFPELYLRLASLGARSFTVPSAFTRVTGEAHFEVLMRSRAIENFSFTIAACQGGDHDSGRQTYGRSMVVGPWGDILCQAEAGVSVLVAQLDFDRQDDIRANMPVHLQRRI
jgi:nitrilase